MKKILFIILVIFPSLSMASPCIEVLEIVEKEYNIPEGLLHAISRVESRRQPYALNINGKSYYLNSKEEALSTIENANTDNIDVGCMQINLKHHPKASASDMLDPVKNIIYAADFLIELKNKHQTWHEAIARYHSSKEDRKFNYQLAILTEWIKIN